MNNSSDMSSSDYNAHRNDENRLKADCFDEFFDSIDLLYIRGNLSGRLKFLEAWPLAAHYIFGDVLIDYDLNGTQDFEQRVLLENRAEERRISLLEVVETLEEKSVEKSVLQIEYVEALVKKLGRDMALLVYAPKIVNRFLPAPVEAEPETVSEAEGVPDATPPIAETTIADEESIVKKSEVVEVKRAEAPPPAPVSYDDQNDRMDSVQPISLEPVVPMPPIEQNVARSEPSLPSDETLSEPLQTSPSLSKDNVSNQESQGHVLPDGSVSVVSQKMTFMPAKKPDEAEVVKKTIPVISPVGLRPEDENS